MIAVARSAYKWVPVVYTILILASAGAMAVGIGYYFRYPGVMPTVTSVGAIALMFSLATFPIAWLLAFAISGRHTGPQHTMEDMLAVLRSINEREGMSDLSKRIIHRHRDHEALINAVRQDIKENKLDSALMVAQVLENAFGLKQEATRLREEVAAARTSHFDQQISEAIQGFEQLLAQKQWDKAMAEAHHIQRTYPNSPRVRHLPDRAAEARERYKLDLETKLREAVNREDVDPAMEILKELDRYLTEEEARPFLDIARDVIAKKRQNLALQFKLAVQNKEWVLALKTGEEITSEFPNSKMADEVRDMGPMLKERAEEAQAAI